MRSSPTEELLLARGSSQRWLAAKLGIQESQLSRYLNRDPESVPNSMYERIAGILQVPVHFLKEKQPA
jgi:transcriptional regulator with XRE-family HTH domain